MPFVEKGSRIYERCVVCVSRKAAAWSAFGLEVEWDAMRCFGGQDGQAAKL